MISPRASRSDRQPGHGIQALEADPLEHSVRFKAGATID
jgi:hypothetical protein